MTADDCTYVNLETGRTCYFPSDYMTPARDPRFFEPEVAGQCGRHMAANHDVEMQMEREHAARVAAMPKPKPYKSVGEIPDCWSWEITDQIRADLAASETASTNLDSVLLRGRALSAFDQGRCAICGNPGKEVEDHSHDTGLVRGWLCRSCNTREGMNPGVENVWGRYRSKHPYSMLGITERYSGRGWEDGRPVGAGPEWPALPGDNAMRGVL